MLTDQFADLGSCFAATFMRCAKYANRHFGHGTLLGRAVDTRAFDDLRNVRKWANLGIHCGNGDIPKFKSAMPTLQLADQIYGPIIEQVLGVFVIVSLVFLDGR